MTTRIWIAALALAALAAGANRARAEWLFQGLGTLGGDYSVVRAVSADGSVAVGFSRNPDGEYRAFRWRDGTMAPIGNEPQWSATGVSADGSVVIIDDGLLGVFRWEDGSVVQLPIHLMAHGGFAGDVSADGSIIVGGDDSAFFNPPDPPVGYAGALVWGPPDAEENYSFRQLRHLSGPVSGARAVSADGKVVVGWSENASGHTEAVRWDDDGLQGQILGLGALGGEWSWARDVSADGSVIVGSADRPDGTEEAFRWEDGTLSGLGLPPGDWEETGAYGVSADGSVVVGYARQTQPEGPSLVEPFIWDQTHGMRLLSTLLSQHGVDLSGWDLRGATGISADGRVIVGNGYHISADRQEGWIATIPEPCSLTALLGATILALSVCLWRRRRG